jgi:hypothetical protein
MISRVGKLAKPPAPPLRAGSRALGAHPAPLSSTSWRAVSCSFERELWRTCPPYCEIRGVPCRGSPRVRARALPRPGLELLAEFLHEVVVDPVVAQRPHGGHLSKSRRSPVAGRERRSSVGLRHRGSAPDLLRWRQGHLRRHARPRPGPRPSRCCQSPDGDGGCREATSIPSARPAPLSCSGRDSPSRSSGARSPPLVHASATLSGPRADSLGGRRPAPPASKCGSFVRATACPSRASSLSLESE